MAQILELVALLTAALFAGAALYINVAEHPARMRLQTRDALRQWAPSYRRATLLQAPLAIASCLAGIVLWLLSGHAAWLIPALLIGAVVPFTFIVILPTNQKLLSPELNPDAPDTRALLVKWGRLHAVRTLLSVVAATLYAAFVVLVSQWAGS